MTASALNLSERDLRLLVQSLEHCLATCKAKEQDPSAPCEDCDAARELKGRLQAALGREVKT